MVKINLLRFQELNLTIQAYKLLLLESNQCIFKFCKTNNTKDTVKIKVNGYSLLGFQVKGFTIGAKINDTWNFSHKI